MENASKALIIAGAILLAILIISLGIIIYRQAAGVINTNALDEVEVTQFNSKFDKYFGNSVRGANVNALVSAVRSNNNAQEDASRKVEIKKASVMPTGEPGTGMCDATTVFNYEQAQTGATYQVKATRYTSAGLISEITFVQK